MSAIDDIGTHRQRLTDRLARVDAQRLKLVEELAELEAAERVLSRFGSSGAAPQRRQRGARKATAADASRRSSGRRQKAQRDGPKVSRRQGMPLREATLQAVEALGSDASAEQIREYLSENFGLRVMPLHLGRALQSHRRAGRIEQHDGRWSMPAEAKAAE